MANENDILDSIEGVILDTDPFDINELRFIGFNSIMVYYNDLTLAQSKAIRKEDVYQSLMAVYYGNPQMSLKGVKVHNPTGGVPYNNYSVVSPNVAIDDRFNGRLREWFYRYVYVGKGFLSAVRDKRNGKYDVSFCLLLKPKGFLKSFVESFK